MKVKKEQVLVVVLAHPLALYTPSTIQAPTSLTRPFMNALNLYLKYWISMCIGQ